MWDRHEREGVQHTWRDLALVQPNPWFPFLLYNQPAFILHTHSLLLLTHTHTPITLYKNLFYWEDSYPSSSLEELVVCPDGLSAVAPRGWETEKEHQSSSLLVMIMLVTLMRWRWSSPEHGNWWRWWWWWWWSILPPGVFRVFPNIKIESDRGKSLFDTLKIEWQRNVWEPIMTLAWVGGQSPLGTGEGAEINQSLSSDSPPHAGRKQTWGGGIIKIVMIFLFIIW